MLNCATVPSAQPKARRRLSADAVGGHSSTSQKMPTAQGSGGEEAVGVGGIVDCGMGGRRGVVGKERATCSRRGGEGSVPKGF